MMLMVVVYLCVVVLRLHHGECDECDVLKTGKFQNEKKRFVSAAEEQETAAAAVYMYA
jgi:hypothetical protein